MKFVFGRYEVAYFCLSDLLDSRAVVRKRAQGKRGYWVTIQPGKSTYIDAVLAAADEYLAVSRGEKTWL